MIKIIDFDFKKFLFIINPHFIFELIQLQISNDGWSSVVLSSANQDEPIPVICQQFKLSILGRTWCSLWLLSLKLLATWNLRWTVPKSLIFLCLCIFVIHMQSRQMLTITLAYIQHTITMEKFQALSSECSKKAFIQAWLTPTFQQESSLGCDT